MDEQEMEKRLTQYIGLSALGDFLILMGLLFVFFGAAQFLSDYLGVKGGGEVGVGVFLVAASFAVFFVAWRILAGPAQKPGPAKKSD